VPCERGRYARTTAATACAECAAGAYAPQRGSTACLTCPPGRAGAVRGASDLATGCNITCFPGFFSFAAATSCSSCPIGTFSNSLRDNCTSCPTGRSSFASSSSLSQCVSGVVCEDGNTPSTQDLCVPCPPGWTTPPHVFPQVCSVPCSAIMQHYSSGCTAAWFASISQSNGCSQGSCTQICSHHGRTCSQVSLTHTDSTLKLLAVARLVDVTCTAQTCLSTRSSALDCDENPQAGIIQAAQTFGGNGHLNPGSRHGRFEDRGPCYFTGPGNCDADDCEMHRFCPCE